MSAIYLLDESNLGAFGDVLNDRGRPTHLLAAEHLARLEDAGVLKVLHRCEHGNIYRHMTNHRIVIQGGEIECDWDWCEGVNDE